MHRIKEYYEEIKGHPEKEERLQEIMCTSMEKIKKEAPHEFYSTMYEIHCAVFGPHFDENLAKRAVAEMRNADGTIGEHWSYEQVKSLANQNNITHCADLYYAMNSLHSDLSKYFGNDAGTYLKMAKGLYFEDIDGGEDKIFLQYYSRFFPCMED